MTVKQAKFTIYEVKTSVTVQIKFTKQSPFFQINKVIVNMLMYKMNRKRLSARAARMIPAAADNVTSSSYECRISSPPRFPFTTNKCANFYD